MHSLTSSKERRQQTLFDYLQIKKGFQSLGKWSERKNKIWGLYSYFQLDWEIPEFISSICFLISTHSGLADFVDQVSPRTETLNSIKTDVLAEVLNNTSSIRKQKKFQDM